MKSTLFFKVLFLYLILTINSCRKPPCNCEPVPVRLSINVKIVNQQGENLLYGPSAQYSPDSILISEQRNNLIPNALITKQTDSTLLFDFYRPSEKSYIYYNLQTLQDSLEIKWVPKTGRCCGEKYTTYDVGSVKFNNATINPVNGILRFIK